jgi:hypothetical protein
VPDQVAGEHADQHVGLHAVFEPVPDGAQDQVVGLDVPEVAFEFGQVLVGGDRAGGVSGRRLPSGALGPRVSRHGSRPDPEACRKQPLTLAVSTASR